MVHSIVPINIEGKFSDLEQEITLPTREEAISCFNRACKRLLNPPIWHELSGALSARFILTDEDGVEVHRLAQLNDRLKIDIPGPGTQAGEGYDWVQIEVIEDKRDIDAEEEGFSMRVRPCANPRAGDDDTAHFFNEKASSSFVVYRSGNTVTASYHGRNELPNVETSKAADNVRNAVIAAGAFAGLSELQWTALIRSLLEEEIGG